MNPDAPTVPGNLNKIARVLLVSGFVAIIVIVAGARMRPAADCEAARKEPVWVQHADRERVRVSLGLSANTKLLTIIPGSGWSESQAPLAPLLTNTRVPHFAVC